MKLHITVTDGNDDHGTAMEAADEKAQLATSNGHAPMETFDGGPVPEMLLSMESEVAAGRRSAPGQPS